MRFPTGTDLRRGFVIAVFEDTVEGQTRPRPRKTAVGRTQRDPSRQWRIGDEELRADIHSACRTSRQALNPLIMGTFRETEAVKGKAAKEILVDFNAPVMKAHPTGWHYEW